jgi:porin
VGTGVVATGFVPQRPADELGLAMAAARNGAHYMALQQQLRAPVQAGETAIELTYLTQINPWLAMQPSFQYVAHPNTTPALGAAKTIQLRFEIAF